MRRYRTLALGAAALVLMVSACTPGGSGSSTASGSQTAGKPAVKVGSAAFYEAAVVGEMYAQALEAKGYAVERHLEIGERPAVHTAFDAGDINLMPEYLGGLAAELTGSTELPADPQQAWDNLQQPLMDKGWVAFDYSPGTDADGFAVRAETADEFGLVTMTDLAAVANQLKWGVAPGCMENQICGPGLKEVYGIDLDQVAELDATNDPCSADMITALTNNVIDVAQVCTTQPDILESNLTLLEDDRALQPAQNIVGIASQDLATASGDELAQTIDAINATLTTDALTELGVEIVVNHVSKEDAATAYLEDNGLL
jgi:osmoprotectant transport system substrate-binding protein